MELLSLSEVSRQSGVSRTSLYRLKRRGVLAPWIVAGPAGRPLLRADVVAELRRGELLRQRVDSPWALEAASAPDPEPEPTATEGLYGCWPADSWQGWCALGWADWRPEEELSDPEHWRHVAGLMAAWLSLSTEPLTGIQAASLCLAADEAREAVAAGVRWNPARWAAAAAAVEADE